MKHLSTFNDFIFEGRRSAYDSLAGELVSRTFRKWIEDWKAKKKESNYYEQVEAPALEFDLDCTIYFDKSSKGFEVMDGTGADGRDEVYDEKTDEWEEQTPFIHVFFKINPEWLPGEWQEVYMHLSDVIRHEMEHITQDGVNVGNYRPGKPDEDDTHMRSLIEIGLLPKHTYLMLPKEVDANLQGLRYEAKKRRQSMIDTVNKYLDTQEYLTDETREEVMKLWRKRAKEIGGIPNF